MHMSYYVKKSYLGGDGDDLPFEEMFGKIAYSYIQDKAPSLLHYTQGFQVVERSEDDKKALGVVGFMVHGMQLYVPVFFMNGELKGHELLRLVDQNLWLPLKEAWLHEIFRIKPISLGTPEDKPDNEILTPDISSLVMPPSKYASTRGGAFFQPLPKSTVSRICKDLQKIGNMRSIPEVCQSIGASFSPISHFKSAGYHGLCRLQQMLDDIPVMKQAFLDLYPQGMALLTKEIEKRSRVRSSVLRKIDFSKIPTRMGKSGGTVSIITYKAVIEGPMPLGLSDEDKTKLVRQGYLVKDDREDKDVSKVVMNIQRPTQLFNPTRTGFYDVTFADGTEHKQLVFLTGSSQRFLLESYCPEESGTQTLTFVYDPETEIVSYKEPGLREWCTRYYPMDYVPWWRKQPEASAIMSKSTYFFADSLGTVIGPVFIEKALGDKRYQICVGGEPMILTLSPKGSTARITTVPPRCAREKSHTQLHAPEIKIPESWKSLAVKQIACQDSNEAGVIPSALKVADYGTFQKAASAGTETLKLVVRSGECSINNDKPVSLFNGFKRLVEDYGLREKTAKWLMKEAESKLYHTIKVTLKRADTLPRWPSHAEASTGLFPGQRNLAPSSEQLVRGTIDTNSAAYPSTADTGYAQTDANAVRDAIARGQKEVFDVTSLKQVYISADTDTDIDTGLAKLVQGMNATGDILVLYYWKTDQFEEIYGAQRLPELEASLKKLFEVAGDVILFLKRNKINKADYKRLAPLELEDDVN